MLVIHHKHSFRSIHHLGSHLFPKLAMNRVFVQVVVPVRGITEDDAKDDIDGRGESFGRRLMASGKGLSM